MCVVVGGINVWKLRVFGVIAHRLGVRRVDGRCSCLYMIRSVGKTMEVGMRVVSYKDTWCGIQEIVGAG